MTLISFICFIIFFLLLFSFFLKDTDIFSPARIFILVWSLAIGLADLKLSRFQLVWHTYSWIVLMVAIISTLCGMFVVFVIFFSKKKSNIHSVRKYFQNIQINSNRLYYFILFLFISYIISFIVTALVKGYIPLFVFASDAARSQWGIFGFGLFIQIVPSLIYFIILYFILAKGLKFKKMVLFFLLLISVLTYLMILQRFYFIYCIILIVVFAYYSTEKINIRNILIVFFLLLLIIYGISSIRTSRYAVNIVHFISNMKYSSKYAIFTEPYMYIVMNLENFANAVLKLENFDYGYNTFDFILALTGLKHPLYEYANIINFPFIVTSNFNTYTMYFAYYRDFGILGLFILSFIFGMIVSYIYYIMKLNPTINNISLYGSFVFVLIFSFFVPITSWLHFIFNLILIFLVTKIIIIKI